jgi:4-hydroxy-2-oxoheptanedioate aldolase
MANKTKEKLDSCERVLGCFIGFYSPAMVEILGLCGFDFVVIDNEHGPFSWGQIEHMVRAAQLRNLTPIVRTVDHEQGTILKALDCGAQGVHVPQVSTADQTESIVRAAKFPRREPAEWPGPPAPTSTGRATEQVTCGAITRSP